MSIRQAQKVAQQMSTTVAEIQKDLKEHRSRRGEGHGGMEFDEVEVRVVCRFCLLL